MMPHGSFVTDGNPPQPSPASSTPVITWSTPWSGASARAEEPPSSRSPMPPGQHQEHQLQQQHQRRRRSLELLELRSMNRGLELQNRRAQSEIADLKDERQELIRSNEVVREDLEDAQILLDHLRREQRKLSDSLAKQAVLLGIEREIRREMEEELERGKAPVDKSKLPRKVSWSDQVDDTSNHSSSAATDVSCGTGPVLPELVDQVRSSVEGSVTNWVKGMLAACAEEIKEALILPWLLHKLFFLCSELINERHQELLDLFRGGRPGDGEKPHRLSSEMDRDTADFMHRHLRRHHATLFPLCGEQLKSAVDDIMTALAHSMIGCKQWDPRSKNPDAVHRALAASGLERIVREYLQILVYCCLQDPEVTFSGDLGQVERFDPNFHAGPIDGEPVDEWCIVIFPALIVAANGGEWNGEAEIVSPRFVLASDGRGARE